MKKTVSYSELIDWHYNRERYIKTYINGEPKEYAPEMTLGIQIHNYLESPYYPFVEECKKAGIENKKILQFQKIYPKIPIDGTHEKSVMVKWNDVTLYSKFDLFREEEREVFDYKTTNNVDRWNQWNVDTNLQLSFYAFIYHLKYFKYLREVGIVQITLPEKGMRSSVRTYRTARGVKDLKEVSDWIISTIQEIKDAGLWEKRLGYKEIKDKQANKLL